MAEKQIDILTPIPETITFAAKCPCRLRTRASNIDEFPMPHYAGSLEIVLTENVRGYVVIGNERFDIRDGENGVFVIPPNVVHYTMFRASPGKICVFKLSLELIADYINVDNLLSLCGSAMEEYPGYLPERYAEFEEILFHKLAYDWNDPWKIFEGLIALFRLLGDCTVSSQSQDRSKRLDERIRLIMQWTRENIGERITVESAAEQLHYSRWYFCRFFKKNVGISYLTYLNSLKIDHAVKLMKQGKSTTFCCYECGFTNLSYFTKLFRKITGYSTVEYRKQQKLQPEDDIVFPKAPL